MTLTELKTKTLQRLGVLAVGESASASDFQLLQDHYEILHAMLIADDLVTWGVEEDIPDEFTGPVRMMLAAIAAADFEIMDPKYTQLMIEGAFRGPTASLAERQLRALLARPYSAEPAQPDYF